MALYVDAESYDGSAEENLPKGGEVLERFGDAEGRGVIVVKFEGDAEEAGFQWKLAVNGTAHREEWACREHARHILTGSP